MSKKSFESKKFSLDEYDEATLSRYRDGIREGMAICSEIVHKEISRMRGSVDDTMAIFMEEAFVGTKHKGVVSELETVYNALGVLSERFEDSFFTKLDSLKEPENFNFDD
jgi:hypothetical protein